MDMSRAALPARYGYASQSDRLHPRFGDYEIYRSSMSRLMVDSQNFSDWLRSTEEQEYRDKWTQHPRFKEWQRWFTSNKMGRTRTLPNGKQNVFPENFKHWLACVGA